MLFFTLDGRFLVVGRLDSVASDYGSKVYLF